MLSLASMALAASPGCVAVNSGQLNYSGPSPTAQLGVVLGQFYPGDQLFMTYTSSSPKAGVVLDLVLTSVSVNTAITGATGTTQSLTATVGALLPIGATAGITDATALLSSRNIVMTVTCSAAATPTVLAVTASTNPTVFGQSTSLTATATALSGVPNGNVIFTIDGIAQPPVALSSGVATLETSALAVGAHVVSASYAGNSNFTAATNTLFGGLFVNKAWTTTSLVSSSASNAFGSNVTYTATATTMAPGSGTPTGSMIFTIDGVDQAPVSMSGGSATFTTNALSVGSHGIAARYVGSANHNVSAVLLSGGQTINKAATTTTLGQSPAITTFRQSPTFRATVTSAATTPTGAVVFTVDGVAQPTTALANGVAELTMSGLAVGNHTVSASYAGTESLNASSSTLTGGHTVAVIPTTTTLSGPGAIVFGNNATITASVVAASGTPSGSVVFTVDGVDRAPVALSNGSTTVTLTGLSAGNHTLSAVYLGAATYGTSNGTLAGGQVAIKLATTTTISPVTAITLGQSANLTATVAAASGTPDGSVTFTIDGAAQSPVTLINGQANLVVPGLAVASHAISASYSGASNFAASAGTANALVIKAVSSLVVNSSANPSVTGQGISLTATANSAVGTPAGSVVFTIDGVEQSPMALAGGTATISLAALAVGSHTVSANYLGSADLLTSSASLPGGQTVARAATTLSLESNSASAAFGAAVSFTAHVVAVAPGAGTPTGNVVFSIDGVAQSAVALSAGAATITRPNLGVDAHTVTALYVGDTDFGPANGALSGGQTVVSATTAATLGFTPASPHLGDTATITATVAAANGVPTGNVIFTVNGVDQSPASMVNGIAQFSLPNLAVSSYTLGARFVGSTSYAPSIATSATMTVAVAATATSVSANPASVPLGEAVTISTTVTATHGTPNGTVEFRADGTLLGMATLTNGTASLSTTALATGNHAITVTYGGSTDHAGSSGDLGTPVAVTAGTTNLSLSANPQPSAYGQTVNLSASAAAIAGIPSGTVIFTVDGIDQPGASLSNGTAVIALSALEPGVHTVTANYAGSSSHRAASTSLAGGIVVDKASATMALASTPAAPAFGSTVTVTATLGSSAGTPTGVVIFVIDGVPQPPQSSAGGVASINLTGLSAGEHSVEARFAGDARFSPVTAGLVNGIEVGLASTTLVLGASPDPAPFGDTVTFTATVAASSGTASGAVVFTIDGVAQTPAQLSGGVATLTTSGLTVGQHAISATYAAQGNFDAISAVLAGGIDIDVAMTQTTLSSPSGAIAVGQTTRFVASVTADHGMPTGSVIFSVDGVEQTPIVLSHGSAELDVVFQGSGNHVVRATYTGAANFGPSRANLAGGIAIAKAQSATALTVSPTSEFGSRLTVTANVTATAAIPGGSVNFYVDGEAAGSAVLSGGVATMVLPRLDAGAHEITAEYNGALDFAASSADGVDIEITPASVSTSISVSAPTIVAGAPVTITVSVISANGPATGDVVISVGSTDHVVTLQNGVATLVVADLSPGIYPVTVDYAGSTEFAASLATLAADLAVDPAPTDIEVTASLPRSVAGDAYAGAIFAYGGVGPYTYVVTGGALPPGLSLDAATGDITGTPSNAGPYSWEITASGTAGASGTYQAQLTVLAPATITLPTSLGGATYGVAFQASVAATEGTQHISYAIASGSLPASLALNPTTGQIAGTPRQLGTVHFTITATDSNGFSGSQSYSLTVAAPTIAISGTLDEALVGAPFSAGVSVTGGAQPYTFSVDGNLPPGLTLDHATGTVSGTPSQAGTFDFAILVADANGFDGGLDVSLTVDAEPLVVLPTTLAVPRENRPYAQALSATGGTGPYSYLIASGALPSGLALNATTGRLTGTPTGSGSFTFEAQATDANGLVGSRNYTLGVQPAPVLVVDATLDPVTAGVAFTGTIDVNGGNAPYSFTIISGSLPSGIALDPATGDIAGTTLLPGTYSFVLDITDANGDTLTAAASLQVAGPAIGVTATVTGSKFGDSITGVVVATGGTSPYAYAVSSGALPDGVSLDPTSGEISGNVAAAGSFHAVVTAIDANNFIGTTVVDIVIAAPTLVLSPLPADFMLGRPVNATLSVSGGKAPYAFTVVGNLPAGLVLDPDSGELTGTPIAVGGRTLVIAATDTDGFTVSGPFTIEIITNIGDADLPSGPLRGAHSGTPYIASVAATGGAAPLTYAITSGALPAGLTLDPATGEISGTTLAIGSFPIEVTVTGSDERINTANYTLVSRAPSISAAGQLDAAEAGVPYSDAVGTDGGTAPYSYLLASGALPDGVALAAGGQITGTPTEAGTFIFVLTVTDTNSFTADLSFALTVIPPEITVAATLPNGRLVQNYAGSISATGGVTPLRFAVTAGALPPGIAIDGDTGVLSGTPTSAGLATFTVTATDANGFTGAGTYDLLIGTNVGTATMVTTLATPEIGQAYNDPVAASGGTAPYSYAVTAGALPPGLSLDPATGVITGTPEADGDFSFGITVTDAGGLINHQNYQVSIEAPTIDVVANTPPAQEGQPYSVTVVVTGGTGPYDFALEDAPAGISIDGNGLISGTPTTPGTHNFAVIVTDANGFQSVQRLTMSVASAAVVLALPAALADATEGSLYAASLVPANAVGAVQYSLANGTRLPSGLQLDGNAGSVTGKPTTPGSYSFDIHAVDSNGNTGDASYVIVVEADQPVPAQATTTTLDVGTTSVALGESVTLTVSVETTGGPADEGIVTITDTASGDIIASGAIGTDGSATFTAAFYSAAGRTLVVSYSGTARFAASDTGAVSVTVTQATTSLALSGTSGSIPSGTPILVVATVTRDLPETDAAGAGDIHFTVDGVDQHIEPATAGSASYSLVLPPGAYQIGARFAPAGAAEVGSDSDQAIIVTATTTTSVDAPTGYVASRQLLTYTATVTPAELGIAITGTATFHDNGTVLATVPVVNGAASYSAMATDPGTHAVTVGFSGDAYYGASTSPAVTHTVVLPSGGPLLSTTTTLTGATAPVVGETLVLTATVVADGVIVATGGVTFVNETTGVALGTAALDSDSVATLALTLVDAGEIVISATYNGDARLLGSSNAVRFYPAIASTEITLTPATTRVQPGASVVLTAQVSRQAGGLPDAGTIAFLADGTAFAHVPSGGSATVTASSDALSGPTAFTAEFIPGPSGADAPSASAQVIVNTVQLVPVVTITASLAVDGSASGTITVAQPVGIADIPSGAVTLTAAGAAAQTLALADGAAEFAYPAGTFGSDVTFAASYAGDVLFAPATGTVNVEQTGVIPTQTFVEVSRTQVLHGEHVTATIHVVADPVVDGGIVEVMDDGALLTTTPVQDGVAVVPLTGLEPGENTVTARYLGTPDHAPSDGNLVSVMVLAAPAGSLSLALSADPGAFYAVGQAITVAASVQAIGGSASNVAIASPIGFSCPRGSLGTGETMVCTATYVVTVADLASGRIEFAASATADGVTAATDSIVLLSVADTIAETFQTLSDNFVADRARVLGTAIPLPDILTRRNAGTRAGTVQASHDENSQVMSFSSSLAEWRNWAAARAADGLALGMLEEPLPVNIWIDARYSIHAVAEDDARWGHLGTVAIGADYLVTDDILAGLMVQGDWSAETSADGSVKGFGFLIGPYVSIALNNNLSFDATVLYGQSRNTASASMFGETFSGDFETSRLSAKAALTGYFEIDQLTVRPNATFVLTSESTSAYSVADADGDAVSVPGGDHLQYRLTAGVSAEYAIALDNGATLTPMVGLDIGVAGELEQGLDPSKSFLGALNTGLQFETEAGLQLGLEVSSELDSGGFSSSSARATIKGRF